MKNPDEAKDPPVCGEFAKTVSQTTAEDPLRNRLRYCHELLRDAGPSTVTNQFDRLIWRESAGQVRSIRIGAALTVGRGGNAELMIPDDVHLSRHHFKIYLNDGNHFLEDLNSRNGTFVNNTKSKIRHVELRDGDFVLAGSQAFVYLKAVKTLS